MHFFVYSIKLNKNIRYEIMSVEESYEQRKKEIEQTLGYITEYWYYRPSAWLRYRMTVDEIKEKDAMLFDKIKQILSRLNASEKHEVVQLLNEIVMYWFYENRDDSQPRYFSNAKDKYLHAYLTKLMRKTLD